MDLKKIVFCMVTVFTLSACTAFDSITATSESPSQQGTEPTASLVSENPVAATDIPAVKELMDSPEQTESAAEKGLWIEIQEPADEAVFDTNEITLKGKASVDSVISIGDEFIYIESEKDPGFSITLTLEEGENIIEVLASDASGKEIYQVLTVYYEPPE